MFVHSFEAICQSRGIAPTRVLDNLGIARSAYSRWAKGGSPSNVTKKKIADYFGLTVAELMEGKTEKAPAQTNGGSEMAQLLTEIRDRPELRTLLVT